MSSLLGKARLHPSLVILSSSEWDLWLWHCQPSSWGLSGRSRGFGHCHFLIIVILLKSGLQILSRTGWPVDTSVLIAIRRCGSVLQAGWSIGEKEKAKNKQATEEVYVFLFNPYCECDLTGWLNSSLGFREMMHCNLALPVNHLSPLACCFSPGHLPQNRSEAGTRRLCRQCL